MDSCMLFFPCCGCRQDAMWPWGTSSHPWMDVCPWQESSEIRCQLPRQGFLSIYLERFLWQCHLNFPIRFPIVVLSNFTTQIIFNHQFSMQPSTSGNDFIFISDGPWSLSIMEIQTWKIHHRCMEGESSKFGLPSGGTTDASFG